MTLGNVIKETTLARVKALAAQLAHDPPPGVIEVVPAFGTVTVFYDPARMQDFATLGDELRRRAERVKPAKARELRTLTIPVCYGGECGPDLTAVAAKARLSEAAVIALHAKPRYWVQAVGFAPGFPYLGKLPAKLHMPRHATPRVRVEAGSVGIGGELTGIYPAVSPGGWQIIGRTPLSLFRPEAEAPALLHMGDRVRFKPISKEEFAAWK
jgi:inhibitor of KinA